MTSSLVPSNHRPLEHALADVLDAALQEISPTPINTVWDAWTCPRPLLPFLAWAVLVDFWEDGWDENTQRQAIADSPAYHRLKGTDFAVDAAMAALGRPANVIDWHATQPEGRRGTFRVMIPLGEGEDEAALQALLIKARRLIDMAKPKSRACSVSLSREIRTPLVLSCGVYSIDRVELGAPPDTISVKLAPKAGIASRETVFIGGFQ